MPVADEPDVCEPSSLILKGAQLRQFAEDGVLVVPRAQLDLSESAVDAFRARLAAVLKERVGCDVARLDETAAGLARLSSTNGAGGILDIFYEDFQLSLAEHPAIAMVVSDLWVHMMDTFVDSHVGPFNPRTPLASVDRLCFRVPDEVSSKFGRQGGSGAKGSGKGEGEGKGKGKRSAGLQRHLAPHLDCCPSTTSSSSSTTTSSSSSSGQKWRPVQCFLALSDCLEAQRGGLEVCPGLHREFRAWALRRAPSASTGRPAPCVGEFTPMRPVEDADVFERMVHVPCRAGDLVLWDNRIPHANSRCNAGSLPRLAVYLKFLPAVEVNRRYVRDQLPCLRALRPPSDFWIHPTAPTPAALEEAETEAKAALTYAFGPLGRRLFGLEPWREGESVADFEREAAY